jgi:hypothetical protein
LRRGAETVAKWKVSLNASIGNVWADLEVEAASQEEAEERAEEQAAALGVIDWEIGDGSIEDISVVNAECIETDEEEEQA